MDGWVAIEKRGGLLDLIVSVCLLITFVQYMYIIICYWTLKQQFVFCR